MSASVVKPLKSKLKVVRAGNIVVLDERIRRVQIVEMGQWSSWT